MAAIKICGLMRLEDVRAAEEAGATYGGVILASGSARTLRPVDVPEIFDGSGLRRVGVFVGWDFDAVSAAVEDAGLDVVQLHGDEEPELARRLRGELGVETWKALRPRDGTELLAGLSMYDGSVDGILLDGWSDKARGGTGTPFPWAEIAAHRDELPDGVSFIAAGGLTPVNVGEMMGRLDPDVVDVSSGVESAPGVKNRALIEEFARAVGQARRSAA